MRAIKVRDIEIGDGKPLFFMVGPCVIESEELSLKTCDKLKKIFTPFEKDGISWIYKSSFDKANRSSIYSFRGPGLEEGLKILAKVKETFNVPVVTDIHLPSQASHAGKVCDVLQIPAFLCRQTDLLVAAAKTGKVVSVKKGQFMSPWDMKNVVEKLKEGGCDNTILIDRGTTFGYNNLVSDMRSIQIMKQLNVPVCFDATHSVQLPGGSGSFSGGQREFIGTLAKAAVAAGADCIFVEAHLDPNNAKSDAASQLPIDELSSLIDTLIKFREVYLSTSRK